MVMFLVRLQVCALAALWIPVLGSVYPSHNTPPVFDFKREWLIPEDEPVGNRISRVRTRDQDNDRIIYGIEPAVYVDGSDYFRIDENTGDVKLAKSLAGQAGNDFYLYITANDGHQTAKIEVYVRVLERNLPPEPTLDVPFSTSRPPSFGAGGSRGGGMPFPGRPFVPIAPHPAHPSTIGSGGGRRRPHPPVVAAAPSPPAVPLHPGNQPPVRQVPEGEGGGSQEKKSEGAAGAGDQPRNKGVDVTSTVLPVVAVMGVAPVVGLLLWLAHRRCKNREKIEALKKAASAARREGSLSDTVGFSYASNPFFRQTTSLITNKSSISDSPVLPRDSKWEFNRHQLHFLGILGEGCFGQVWKCKVTSPDEDSKDPDIVAVKTLRENASEKEKKDLLGELGVMQLLEPHPNVVTLLGCCTDRDPILVIMEYVPRGKLQTYLRESRAERLYGNLHPSSRHLSARDLTSFAYNVARGMDYLASKGIIHRDLAARNVLVDENKVCKVADFGFARDVMATHVYERKSEGRLPIRWMAPESLFDNIYTTKTDVWSFGVLLWEIVTLGSTPYPGLSASEVMKRVREGYRLEKPTHCRREMYNIMFYCWEKDPADRPTFAELVTLLDKLLLSENIYIELERFPDHSYYNITDLSGEKL